MSEQSTLQALSAAADNFGPFFFALLFVMIITSTAYRWYSKAECSRPRNPQYVATCRIYFFCSAMAGLICVAISIAWWINARISKLYTYEVAIANVPHAWGIDSEFFQKRMWVGTDSTGEPLEQRKTKCVLLITQQTPFRKGQKFLVKLRYVMNSIGATAASGAIGEAAEADLYIEYRDPPVATLILRMDKASTPVLFSARDEAKDDVPSTSNLLAKVE